MMDYWKQYVNSILADRNIEDVAIISLSDSKHVWAAKSGGPLPAISPEKVGLITGRDRKMFLLTGIIVTGEKCGVIHDNLMVDEDNMMDVGSKGRDSRSLCIGKTRKALIFLMGKKGVHGGTLNQKVHNMIVSMKA